MTETEIWRETTRSTISETLKDPVVTRLLERSNVTMAQFETLLIDQLGHDMANKRLTREEMAQLARSKKGISRGALNRTLRQARENVSESIHTVLLLGYGGLIESPSLMPFLDASERLRSQTSQLKETADGNSDVYAKTVEALLDNLEEAFEALYGRNRDT